VSPPPPEYITGKYVWADCKQVRIDRLRSKYVEYRLLEEAARRRVDTIVVWKLDRAFRSVPHMVSTVE
jgi:hypothetical protein